MTRNYGWVVVAAGALLTCVGMGSMFSLPVFLQPMSEATGWSRTGIGLAMTISFLTMGVGGFFWGTVSDRFGARLVVLFGAILLGSGIMLASRATSLLEFQLIYGIMVGLAAGSFFAPMIATVTGWFETHRSLAVSLVSAGTGIAPMTIAPFARWLISTYDRRTAQLVIGAMALLILVPVTLLVRRPPVVPVVTQPGRSAVPDMGVGAALRSRAFIVLALTFFACCATHAGPIFHTVSYAIGCGLPVMTAVTIYSAEGLAGLGGRLIFGLMGDRFGAKQALILGLAIQAVAALGYFFVREAAGFYTVAIVFGMAYGGVMPLYAVLARQYFGPRIVGSVFGAAAMVSSVGMALGAPIGGWIFDHFANYGWLYIGSSAVGLMAVAIALLLPGLPRRAALA